MGVVSALRRNSLFVLLTHAIRLVANFFVFIGIARLYGPEEFGQFTAAHTLSTIFLLLADYGFDTLLVTEIAHRKTGITEMVQSYFSMKIIFVSIATLSMIVVVSVSSFSPTTRMLAYMFTLYVLFSSIINYFFFLFRSREEFHKEANVTFIMNGTLLLAVLVLGILHASLLIIAVTFILTRLVGIVVAVKSAKDIFAIGSFRFALVTKETFFRINIFGLYGIFGTVLFTLDTVLISILSNDLDVGIYQTVIKLVSLGLLLSDVLVYSVLPSLSQKYEADRPHWLKLVRYSHRTLVFMGTFVSFFLIVFPSDILTMVYGADRFDAAVPILRLFGWVIAVRYFSEAGGLILTSSHQQARRLTVVILATLINLSANLIFIPRYGINGAAVISLVTNIFVGIGYLWYGGTFRHIWAMEIIHCVPLVIAVCLGILFWSGSSLSVWISLPFSAVALLLSIFFFGYNKNDRYKLLSWSDS